MNRRGQALVEFVLILPVFILILLSMIDFGNILSSKNNLEGISTDVVRLILNGKSVSDINGEYSDVSVEVSNYKDGYRKIIVKKKVDVITPFLDRILGNSFVVKVERIIPDA